MYHLFVLSLFLVNYCLTAPSSAETENKVKVELQNLAFLRGSIKEKACVTSAEDKHLPSIPTVLDRLHHDLQFSSVLFFACQDKIPKRFPDEILSVIDFPYALYCRRSNFVTATIKKETHHVRRVVDRLRFSQPIVLSVEANFKGQEKHETDLPSMKRRVFLSAQNRFIKQLLGFPETSHLTVVSSVGTETMPYYYSIGVFTGMQKSYVFLPALKSSYNLRKSKRNVSCDLYHSIIASLAESVEDPDSSRFTMNKVYNNQSKESTPLVLISNPSNSLVQNRTIFHPTALASWLGVIVIYLVTAVVFGTLDALTADHWDPVSYLYFVLYQLLTLIFGSTGTGDHWQMSSRQAVKNQNNNNTFLNIPSNEDYHDMSRERSSYTLLSSYDSRLQPLTHSDGSCGQLSKNIFYGMIRVVSFIAIAVYEGRLYNAITFPTPPSPLSNESDLISSDKYNLKMTGRVETEWNNTSRTPSQFVPVLPTTAVEKEFIASKLKREVVQLNAKHSLDIADCINWVETNSLLDEDKRRKVCIGYEFELRNFQKSQKLGKLIISTTTTKQLYGPNDNSQQVRGFLRQSDKVRRSAGQRAFSPTNTRRKLFSTFVESGVMNLLKLVDSGPPFIDGFQKGNMTIQDYNGLFTVYTLLLLISTLMFLCEFSEVKLSKPCCNYHCRLSISIRSILLFWKRCLPFSHSCRIIIIGKSGRYKYREPNKVYVC